MLQQFHASDAGSDAGRVADMLGVDESDPALHDESRCGLQHVQQLVGNRALRPGEALATLLPPSFWRLAFAPFNRWNNATTDHFLPTATPKSTALAQLRKLQQCATLGDEAGFQLAYTCFKRWAQHLQAQQEERRRNQLIKSALDRKFSPGGLQQRYLRKWMHWLKWKKKQQRRAVFMAPPL